MPLSPISEGIASVPIKGGDKALPVVVTRPVTAAVSDESVAADSGVFEASVENLRTAQNSDVDNMESAQINIGLNYDSERGALFVSIDQAKNLRSIGAHQHKLIFVKAVLLPCPPSEACELYTKRSKDVETPVFGEQFHLPVLEVIIS